LGFAVEAFGEELVQERFFISVVSAISRSCCSIDRCTNPSTVAIFCCSHGGGMTMGKVRNTLRSKVGTDAPEPNLPSRKKSKKNAMKQERCRKILYEQGSVVAQTSC
jgi:hypothetical protein